MPEDTDPSEEFSKHFEKLREELQARDAQNAAIDSKILALSAELQREIQRSFESDTVAHRAHISSLYSKFERIIYVVVILGVGVATYLGFEVNKIPDTIDAAVSQAKENMSKSLENEIASSKSILKKKFEEITAPLDRDAKKLIVALEDRNRSATASIDDIDTIVNVARNDASTAEKYLKEILKINNEAKKLQTETSSFFNSAIQSNSASIQEIRAEIAIVRYKNTAPKTKKEITHLLQILRDSVALAKSRNATFRQKDIVKELLFVVSNIAPDETLKDNEDIINAIRSALPRDESERLTIELIRAGIIFENNDVIERLKNTLAMSPENESARGRIEYVLDTLRTQIKKRFRQRRMTRKSISAHLVSELIALANLVTFPSVARKSMELIDFGEMKINQRVAFNTTLERWALTKELNSRTFDAVLRRLPLDLLTARFLSDRLQNSSKVDDKVKRRANDIIIDRASRVRNGAGGSIIGHLRRELSPRNVGKNQNLVLKYFLRRYEEELFNMTASQAYSNDWSYSGVTSYSIGGSNIVMRNLRQVELEKYERSRIDPFRVELTLDNTPLRMDGNPVIFRLSTSPRFVVLSTNRGRTVILRHFYDRNRNGLNIGFALEN